MTVSTGAVHVYDEVGGAWSGTQRLELPVGVAQEGDGFGSALALDGDRLVVGAPTRGLPPPPAGPPSPPAPAQDRGAAYLFTRSGGVWSLDVELTDGGAFLSAFDEFGTSVALSGNIAVVGAPGNDSVGTDAGIVLAFVKCGGTWCLQGALVPYDLQGDDYSGAAFGSAVAIAGDTIVVGAPGDDGAGGGVEDAGSAWIYEWNGGPLWELTQVLDAGASQAAFARFGTSVAIDGETILVGAPGEGEGAAYAFHRSGSAWLPGARLAEADGETGDGFGTSVDVLEDVDIAGALADLALVGSPFDAVDFVNGFRCGSTHLYLSLDGTSWTATGRLTSFTTRNDDGYGTATALGRGAQPRAILGAPFHRDALYHAGGAFVHALDTDCDGNAVPDVLDVAFGTAANDNGNCILDACEVGPSFEPEVFEAGEEDGPLLVSGGAADPGLELLTYLANASPGAPSLDFDEVPGEGSLPAVGRAFAHTLTELTDHMTGATLEIGIRATTAAGLDPSDDGLALEVLDSAPGAPQPFHWESPLADLPEASGGTWTHGSQAVFTLDLTALPLVGGGTANLLAQLGDRELDVLVEDASGVDFLRLGVAHHVPLRQYAVRYDPDEGTPHVTVEAVVGGLPEVDEIVASEDVLDRIDVVAYEELPSVLADAPAYPWLHGVELWPRVFGAAGEEPDCDCMVPVGIPPIPYDLCYHPRTNSTCTTATLEDVLRIIGVDRLHPPPYNPTGTLPLTGAGVQVGMLDLNHPGHDDLCGRIELPIDQRKLTNHATQVAGILAGDGTTTGGIHHGVAPEATLVSYSRSEHLDQDLYAIDPDHPVWDQPAPPAPSQILDGLALGVSIYNNSWGLVKECEVWGRYVMDSPELDALVRQFGVTLVFAAGNEQKTSPTGSCSAEPFGRILPHSSAKNVITVGGLCASGTVMPKTPSFGPTRDGRLKPDVVAISERIVGSPHSEGGFTGHPNAPPLLCACGLVYGLTATSFATPQVTGLVALLAQANGGWIDPTLAKALLCNTARDVVIEQPTPTPAGPDFKTGYGLVDGLEAYRALAEGRYVFGSLGGSDEVDLYDVVLDGQGRIASVTPAPPAPAPESPANTDGPSVPGTSSGPGDLQGTPLPGQGSLPKLLLAWADPPCRQNCDDPDPATGGALFHDLDLHLESPAGGVYEPWTLDPYDPEKAATRKVNRRDPVEQITLGLGEVQPGTWRLEVRGEHVPKPPQSYVLTWAADRIRPRSGIAPQPAGSPK